jgi:hypothetical protein
MGIEGRLHEYIRSAEGKSATEYRAGDLLKRLLNADPHAKEKATVIFIPQGSSEGFSMSYTPVTAELVKAHHELGGLLHATFFSNNPQWSYRLRLADRGTKSLFDWRDRLAQITDELDKATSGNFLRLRGPMFGR